MDAKLLRLILLFGEIFAMTPPTKQTKKSLRRFFVLVFLVLLMATSTLSLVYFRQPLHANFTEIKLVVTIGMVIILDIFTCFTTLAPLFCKEEQHKELIRGLFDEQTQSEDSCGTVPRYLMFVIPNLIYWVIMIYVAYVWTDILGIDYYKQYLIEVIQLYFQFYYNYMICVIVKTLLSKYKYVNFLLVEQLRYMQNRRPISTERFPLSMRRVEDLVCSLKEMNVTFNDIFGWPIILTILYSNLLLLSYLDDIFKNSFGYNTSQYVGVIVSNISVVLLTNSGTIVFILLCDSILSEMKTTIFLSYKLRRYAVATERQEISDFINVVNDNFPAFSAAGFFSINKTTIFHVLGTVTTFFIIIIQFNATGRV